MNQHDIVVHLARFGGALRQRGIDVSLSDELDGAAALTLVDLFDRDEVHRALRTALKIQRRDWEVFDELFERLWAHAGTRRKHVAGRPWPRPDRRAPVSRFDGTQVIDLPAEKSSTETPDGDIPGYSPEALLRHKPFDQCCETDLAAMERLLARLAVRLATRLSRRLVPVRTRGITDLRRSFRRAIATGGEFLELARRARAVEEPRLVLLCDTSGSMDAHTRFLLAFVLSLKRVARRTEIFAFNTSLTRLTPWLTPGRIGPVLDRLAAGVPDWSGGTKIGESLADFVAHYQSEVVDGKTVVVILSDGLDRGDTTRLVRAMRAIGARARKLIWLNPLLGDPRYRPAARGMEAALPFVDHFAPAHNLASLERLLPLLAA